MIAPRCAVTDKGSSAARLHIHRKCRFALRSLDAQTVNEAFHNLSLNNGRQTTSIALQWVNREGL